MKTKYIKHLAVLGMLTLGVSSCDLGVVPPDAISADSYWKTEQDAWYAMNEIYANGMPDFIDGISDEVFQAMLEASVSRADLCQRYMSRFIELA